MLRTGFRYFLAAAFLFAGGMHILHPRPFLRITPAWVPHPQVVIALTGWCELAGAIGLLVPRTRSLAGILLATYTVCVFPANIKHAIDDLSAGTGLPGWYHWPRLAFQPVIVAWCLWAGRVWPKQRT